MQEVGRHDLVERDRELARIADAVDDAVAGRGALLRIEGPAGIGKTALTTAAARTAARRGMRVLTARGGELEQAFAHGVVRQLFERTLLGSGPAEREALLGGAARLAAPVVGVGEPAAADEHSVLHGLYWLCMNLAAERPVLLTVDDAHWSDAASLRFVGYLARRLEEAPVLLLVAARPAETDADRALLAAVADDAAALRPAALTADGVGALLGRRLGPVSADFGRACRRVTGGNAFLLGQLADALAAERITPDDAAALRVGELGPPSVSASVWRRIDRLAPQAGRLARAVAVLGRAATLRHAAALAELDPAVAARCADALAATDVLAARAVPEFVHPIVRRAVYDAIPAGERGFLHARTVTVLVDAGADAESVAPHLLAVEPGGDAAAVRLLRDAAARSLARGAPDAATTYLRRALAEPPDDAQHPAVLRELGRAEVTAGAPGGVDHLRAALAATRDAVDRAGIARELATGLVGPGRYAEAVDCLERAVADLPDPAGDLGVALTAELATVARLHPSTAGLSRGHGERLASAAAGGPTPARFDALASLSLHRLLAGAPATEVGSLAVAALTGDALPEGAVRSHLLYDALAALWATDRVEDARRAHEQAVTSAQRCGSLLAFARASTFRAQLRLRRGALREAEADARTALHVADPAWPITRLALGALVEVLVERGLFDEAGRELAARDGAGPIPFTFMAGFLLWARCRLGVARGAAEGLEDLGEFARRERTWPGRSPVWFGHRALLASALAVRGRRDEAVRLAEDEVGLARRWGAPAVVGAALRGHGLVRGGEDGLATLREAVDVLAGSPARLEHARAVVDLGVALRRAGRREPSRDLLATGLDLASGCGADALAERARDELRAAGARPRRDRRTGPSALTAAELRVARMAADGMGNKEIAQALFVTLRTVQLHLTHAYRKLGIASRDELDASLGTAETLRPAP